jgi:hypothetical protein
LDPGDEIGVLDMSGGLETVDPGTTPEYGELLVGSAVWTGGQAEVSAVMSIDLSDFNGPILNGAVDGNTVFYKVWKADEDAVYMAEAEYSVGNGTFGELFLSISLLSPIFSVEQSIELMPYMMNSLSFNVQLEDPSVESCFEGVDVLLASNDAQGFYVPQFGVNSIGDVSFDMGLNTFISGTDAQTLNMEGVPVDPSVSTITLEAYMLNLISYLPSGCMATDDVFASIEDELLLVKDDAGAYYVP